MIRKLCGKDNKASIMIIVLWSLCLLSIFAVYLGYVVRQKMTLVKRLDEKSKLYLTAEAGVRMSIVQIRKQAKMNCQALKDEWSNSPDAFKDINIGDGTYNICYNYVNEQSRAVETRFGIVDEERKININKVDWPVLARLFSVVAGLGDTDAQELAASIEDWRDADSETVIPYGSAENPYYTGLTHPYSAKNSDIEVLEELLLVKGMTQDIFDKIKDYITIYGSGKININTASRPELLAIGLNPDMADKILLLRRGKDDTEATADDTVFTAAADVLPLLSQNYNLSASDITAAGAVIGQYCGTRSNYFMIQSIAAVDNKRYTFTVRCVADKDGKILYWHEN